MDIYVDYSIVMICAHRRASPRSAVPEGWKLTANSTAKVAETIADRFWRGKRRGARLESHCGTGDSAGSHPPFRPSAWLTGFRVRIIIKHCKGCYFSVAGLNHPHLMRLLVGSRTGVTSPAWRHVPWIVTAASSKHRKAFECSRHCLLPSTRARGDGLSRRLSVSLVDLPQRLLAAVEALFRCLVAPLPRRIRLLKVKIEKDASPPRVHIHSHVLQNVVADLDEGIPPVSLAGPRQEETWGGS